MKYLKNITGYKFKRLEKDINKTLQYLQKIEFKKKSSPILKIIKKPAALIVSIAIILLFCGIFFVMINNSLRRPNGHEVSYVGQMKMIEELDSMANIEGAGGNEIRAFDTNSSELKFFFYKIKRGESIYTISKKLGITMDTLISLNSMDDAHRLGEGKRIIVPNLQGILYNIRKGDTIESIAKKYKISSEDILDANDLSEEGSVAENTVNEGQILFLPGAQLTESERAKALGYLFAKPIFGRFTSGFGIRHDPFTGEAGYHPGIDIAAPIGSPVKAAKEGRVEFTGWYGGYGKCIIIKHQLGFETVYGHLSSIKVKKDDWVKIGQFIGRVGNTGYSTGAHLHFEIRKFGRPTNPIRLSGLGKGRGVWY